MAEPLEADLDLVISQALRSVEDLRREIEDALTSAASAFEEEFSRVTSRLPDIEPELDTSDIAPAIEGAIESADSEVPVEAEGTDQLTLDVSDAVAAVDGEVPVEATGVDSMAADIDGALASVDGTVPVEATGIDAIAAELDAVFVDADRTIAVDADTTGAIASVDELTSSLADLESGLGSTGGGGAIGGLDTLSGLGDLAQGSVSGLGAAVGGLGGKAAALTGVVGGLGGAVGVFFGEAVDAKGATQRFNAVLGDMANEVENLRSIDGLNTNLGDLALQLGSDDDKIRTVAARLFELAEASGIAERDASQFTQRMVALGARAVALNPELGDVGDVTDALSTALVRGGRFASKFGLDLSAAEINARALKDTNKVSADELSFVEKAMAGAAIATEKYGGNLDKVIARGSENAITKLRRLKQTVVENVEALGAPLVAPIFELMEKGVPVTEDLGRVVAALARGALPPLIAALEVVTPLLEIVADVMEAIPGPVLAAAGAFAAFRGPVKEGTTFLQSFGRENLSTLDKMGRATVGVGLLASGFEQAGKGGKEGALGIASMAAGGAALGSVIPGVGTGLGALAGAAVGLGKSLFGGGESADEFKGRISELSRELKGLSDQKAVTTFLEQVKDGFEIDFATGGVTANVANIRKELEQLARVDPGAATRILDQLERGGNGASFTAGEMRKLRASVDEGAEAFGRQADKARAAAELNREIAAAADTSATAYDRAKASADEYRASLEQLDAGHTSAFQAETQFAQATEAVRVAMDAAKGSIALNTEEGVKNRDALVNAANQARTYSAAILEAGGGSDAARAPLAALATQITDTATRFGSSPQEVAKLLQSLGLLNFASPEVQAAAAAMGLAVTEQIGGKSEEAANRTKGAMDRARGAIDGAGLPQAAGRQARGAVDEFGNPIQTGLPGAVQGGVDASRAAFDRGALKEHAGGVGHAVGRSFGEGIAEGIYARTFDVAEAAAAIVRAAERAARAEARSSSPSKLFAELGEDMTEGVSVGMDAAGRAVVRSAEDIVRNAARAIGPLPAGAVGGSLGGGPIVFDIDVAVSGDMSDQRAREIGEQVGRGAVDGAQAILGRRQIKVDSRLI